MPAEVWTSAASILEAVPLDRDSLHKRFTSIPPPRPGLTTLSAKKRKNAGANRYANILPYDHNCVKIMAQAEEGSRGRYINASVMQVRNSWPWHACAVCAHGSHAPTMGYMQRQHGGRARLPCAQQRVAQSVPMRTGPAWWVVAAALYSFARCAAVAFTCMHKQARSGSVLPVVLAHPACRNRGGVSADSVQAAEHDAAQWRYIATQGPLPYTVEDFWLMVVEQECTVVVMLTDMSDCPVKCYHYFPASVGARVEVRHPPALQAPAS